jgi:hypothetical protein
MNKKKSLVSFTILTLLIVAFGACQKNQADTSITSKEAVLSLKAPSGVNIASNITALKSEASEVVSKKFNAKVNFEITDINYLPVKTGYAAIISYKTQEGISSNYAVFNGVKFKIVSQSIKTDVNTSNDLSSLENSMLSTAKIKIVCSRIGTCECKVEGTVDMNTGIITWRCSCEQCAAEVTTS